MQALLIIGCRYGKNNNIYIHCVCYLPILLMKCHEFFRTGQEEMRTHLSKQLALRNKTIDEESIDVEVHTANTKSFTLSTETCMTVHGVILASLFIIAISRYCLFLSKLNLKIKKSILVNVFLDQWHFTQFAYEPHKNSTTPCSQDLFRLRCVSLILTHQGV